MKRFFLGLFAVGIVGVAVALSAGDRSGKVSSTAGLIVTPEARNPWTNLNLNNDPEEFQFAIVSDRTGGHRSRVFSQAIERLNLMQPEFVLSVGDLIEGGNKTDKQLADEWTEFDKFIGRLKMPFFYVPGNHDVGNTRTDKLWQDKFGRRHYHFVYRNVLFLCLNTEDPPGSGPGHLGKEQVAYAKGVLEANRNVRWTIVAMHKPVWTASNLDRTGWLDVEKALAGRPYTVFVGHVHRYQKFVRNGQNYYQLATTGGSSKMRGVERGEFDHFVWVTMKKDGPVLANILIDAVLPEDLKPIETTEPGVSTRNRKPVQPFQGKVFFEGAPVPQAFIAFQSADPKVTPAIRADGMAEADGSFTLSTYTAFDGIPAGEYAVTVVWRKPFYDAAGKPGPNLLPARYASATTSPLKVTIKEGPNEAVLELQK